jgi:hypothetical protein
VKTPHLLLFLLLPLSAYSSAMSSPTQDERSRANEFCDQLQLVDKSIDSDYELITAYITDQNSKASFNKVRTQVKNDASYLCNQWKEGKIALEEFTAKEIQILQFAFDLENARRLVDTKENKPNTKPTDLFIKPISDRLHIPVKQNVVTGQSGAKDIILTTVERIVSKYATTAPVKK